MSGQYVNTTALIDTFCIRVIPGTFTQCDHTRHHSWRHFRLNMNFTTIVKDPDFIAVVDTAFLRIKRVDPHFLTASRFQHINVAVS